MGSLDAGAAKSASDVATTTEAATVSVALDASESSTSDDMVTVRAARAAETGSSLDLLTTRDATVRELAAAADRIALRALAAMDVGTVWESGTLPTAGVWFEWVDGVEYPLTLEGEWNGTSIVPLVLETVT